MLRLYIPQIVKMTYEKHGLGVGIFTQCKDMNVEKKRVIIHLEYLQIRREM